MSVVVAITGAAGRIAYSLILSLLNGLVFGPDVKIDLRLLDIEDASEKLNGLRMEIEDCNFLCLSNILATTSAEEAFRNADIAVLLGMLCLKTIVFHKHTLYIQVDSPD